MMDAPPLSDQHARVEADVRGLCPASAGLKEQLEPFGQELSRRLQLGCVWRMQSLSVEPLQTKLEHRPIRLVQDVRPQLDHEVRPHAEDVAVERGVVQLAESQSVRDDGLSPGVSVWENVGRVQKLGVTQTAHGTALAIGPQDAPAKRHLMEATLGKLCDVLAASFGSHRRTARKSLGERLVAVDRDGEGETSGLIAHDVDGPDGEVVSGHNTVEVDKRRLSLHREA
jgi:hypothetical protein